MFRKRKIVNKENFDTFKTRTLTYLFQLSKQCGGIDWPRSGHPMQLLLLLSAKRIQKRLVLHWQTAELTSQWIHQITRNREFHCKWLIIMSLCPFSMVFGYMQWALSWKTFSFFCWWWMVLLSWKKIWIMELLEYEMSLVFLLENEIILVWVISMLQNRFCI